MSSESLTAAPDVDAHETWREIDEVVQSIARLARAGVSSDRFFAALVEACVTTLAAQAGAVWLLQEQGCQLEYQINLGITGLVTSPGTSNSTELAERQQQHEKLLRRVIDHPEVTSLHPSSGAGSSTSQNPTEFLLLLCPIVVDAQTLGVIEIFQRPNASPAAVQGFLRFVSALAEFAADFLRNHRLHELQERASLWSQFERFVERVHERLDVAYVAAVIANDGRLLVNCDRISVATWMGSTPRVIAVSGVDRIDRRSASLRAGEALLKQLLRTKQPLWFDDSAAEDETAKPRSPQIDRALHEFLNVSQARWLAIMPLFASDRRSVSAPTGAVSGSTTGESSNRVVGAVLFERFSSAQEQPRLKQHVTILAQHSGHALANALEHSNLPFYPFWSWLGRLGWYVQLRQLPRTLLVLGLVAAAILSLIYVPADFTIEGRGELQPALRRGIFASADGIVAKLSEKLAPNKTADVERGEVLVELSNSRLDFERTRVAGDLQTAKQKLATTQVERLTIDRNDPRGRSKLEQLASEEKELEASIRSLDSQLEILKRQQEELRIQSPINGQVLTWDATQLLERRPVRQGDRLLEVADVRGTWQLQIRVPDQQIGYVRDASRDLKSDLDVSFGLATEPSVAYRGRVTAIAPDARSHGDLGPCVLLTVSVEEGSIPTEALRPGATVISQIHCGRRSLGFVWFHDLIQIVKTKLYL